MEEELQNEFLGEDVAGAVNGEKKPLLIDELGWSKEQALETRMRLRTFEEEWDAPGMEGYNDL